MRNLAARLAFIEIWPVTIAIVLGALSTTALTAALLVVGFFWGCRLLAYGRPSVRTIADLPIMLLTLLLPLTLWMTTTPDLTVPQTGRLLLGVGLFYAVVNWTTTPRRLHLMIMGTLVLGLSLSIITPFTLILPLMNYPIFVRSVYRNVVFAVTDTINPNVMAGLLGLLFPIALGLAIWGRDRTYRAMLIVALLSTPAFLATLVLTQARGALLAVFTAAMALVSLRWRYGWLLFPLTAVMGLGAVQVMGMHAILDAIIANSFFSGIDNRVEIWSRALMMIRDFPLTGIGMGSFEKVHEDLYPLLLTPVEVPHAHNLMLQIGVDLGLPGLVAWLAIGLLVLVAAWQVCRHGRVNHNSIAAAIGSGLFGSQIVLFIHGLTDAVTWGMIRPAVLVWALWGLAIASWRVYVRPLER